MPNGKPDQNYQECKGSGQIVLFTSVRECECVNEIAKQEKIDGSNVILDSKYFRKEYEAEPFVLPPIESLPI